MVVRRAIHAMWLIMLLGWSIWAQTFDAASVRRSGPNDAGGSTFEYLSGGGLRVRNGTLRGLIESAYDIRDFQILEGPQWLDTERFNVLARGQSEAEQGSPVNDIAATRLKLRTLLAERFALVVHRETRDIQEYSLTIEGKPKLVANQATVAQNPRVGVQSSCGHMMATSASMTNLAVAMSRQLRRPVIDRTGLDGRYIFELDWTPELTPCPGVSDGAPSIFTALREQLGLRLVSIRGPVDAVIVDRAERPSED